MSFFLVFIKEIMACTSHFPSIYRLTLLRDLLSQLKIGSSGFSPSQQSQGEIILLTIARAPAHKQLFTFPPFSISDVQGKKSIRKMMEDEVKHSHT